MGTKLCNKCKYLMDETSDFCESCGTKYGPLLSEVENSQKIYTCKSCKQEIGSDAKFCSHCGYSQEATKSAANTQILGSIGRSKDIKSDSYRNAYQTGAAFGMALAEDKRRWWGVILLMLCPVLAILLFFGDEIFGGGDSANQSIPATQVKQPAQNTELENNSQNCSRVGGMSTSLKQMISQTIQVSTDSISFIRTEMSPTFGCEVVVDTFKGIKRCSFLWILDPNNGDPPFAATELGPGGVPCE